MRLREYDVKVIRRNYQKEMLSKKYVGKPRDLIKEIANEFDVKPSCIYRIINRKTWKNI
ncbi:MULTISPECIES: hypothetical protein [Cytobacillus]|uniref:hypothetical protein n=1 Tax=Cytobacillus TaxID=2675230 RepID=UPI0003147389|nr:hypothetical protein [Cytobacillus oceanisediminis]MCM3402822.1 hypothetical protein [Cytobacillus oceanisediminis]